VTLKAVTRTGSDGMRLHDMLDRARE